jgi:hypothetical protein
MHKYVLKRFRIDLNMGDLTDEKRDDLVARIAKMAPTSKLIQASPAMAASVSALATKAATFKASRDTTAATRQVLAANVDTENQSRAAVDLEILTLAGLVAPTARQSADITGAGFDERAARRARPFVPPDGLAVSFPRKVKGRFKVAPKGDLGRNWVVQVAPDDGGRPGAWSEVPGTAKTRIITGASGSRVWVRYAMVRGMEVSAWGTAVLVTIP